MRGWIRFGSTVLYTCPSGHRSVVLHKVSEAGVLDPSLGCPTCGHHIITAIFDGWPAR